jgi:hypothetical protein
MTMMADFERRLPARARRIFRSFTGPVDIQRCLDSMPYVGENRDRCPLDVLKDGQCHCLDGGLFAALALRRLGYAGLLIDLVPARDRRGKFIDDDHVLAIFRRHGAWGAVAKSNYAWLRYREPVYRTLRELVMSYFEVYFSVDGTKTLRGYTRPLNIAHFDRFEYAWDEGGAAELYGRLYRRTMIPLISKRAAAELQPVDRRAYESGTVGVDFDWVHRPPAAKSD